MEAWFRINFLLGGKEKEINFRDIQLIGLYFCTSWCRPWGLFTSH